MGFGSVECEKLGQAASSVIASHESHAIRSFHCVLIEAQESSGSDALLALLGVLERLQGPLGHNIISDPANAERRKYDAVKRYLECRVRTDGS
jgi:hypothetical protein